MGSAGRDIGPGHVQPASTCEAGPLRRLLKMSAVPTMIAAPSNTGMARKLQPGLTSSTTIGSAPAGGLPSAGDLHGRDAQSTARPIAHHSAPNRPNTSIPTIVDTRWPPMTFAWLGKRAFMSRKHEEAGGPERRHQGRHANRCRQQRENDIAAMPPIPESTMSRIRARGSVRAAAELWQSRSVQKGGSCSAPHPRHPCIAGRAAGR